jgi:hypothetical protein
MPFSDFFDPPIHSQLIPLFNAVWGDVVAQDLAVGREDAVRALIASSLSSAVKEGERDPGRLKTMAFQAVLAMIAMRSSIDR